MFAGADVNAFALSMLTNERTLLLLLLLLLLRTLAQPKKLNIQHIDGGDAANKDIRAQLWDIAGKRGYPLLCTSA